MRKEDLWEIHDCWNGKPFQPDGRVHFHTLKDAPEKVEGFAGNLESNVPITLEDDGTYQFFGNGKEVFRWKG